MKILFIVSRFPYPLITGDRLTIFNYIKHLSRQHEITLISFIESKKELEYLEKLKPFCKRIETVLQKPIQSYLSCVVRLFSGYPLQVSYFYSKKMSSRIRNVLAQDNFDLIYIHTIRMAEYVKDINSYPKVLALQISMSLNYRRLKLSSRNIFKKIFYWYEYNKVRTYEVGMTRLYDKCLLISQADRDELEKISKIDNIFLNPHGVDFRYFVPDSRIKKEENSIVFTGNMKYAPNVDAIVYFCREIYPIIKREISNLKVYIVGMSPARSIKSLAAEPNIIVTGFVKDIRFYSNICQVGIDPLRIGAGLQNKILEGMSMGLPMVVSSIANEGIGAVNGENILIADGKNDFAMQVIRLLRDEALRNRLSKSAREFIEREFTWEKHLISLENIMFNLCSKKT